MLYCDLIRRKIVSMSSLWQPLLLWFNDYMIKKITMSKHTNPIISNYTVDNLSLTDICLLTGIHLSRYYLGGKEDIYVKLVKAFKCITSNDSRSSAWRLRCDMTANWSSVLLCILYQWRCQKLVVLTMSKSLTDVNCSFKWEWKALYKTLCCLLSLSSYCAFWTETWERQGTTLSKC